MIDSNHVEDQSLTVCLPHFDNFRGFKLGSVGLLDIVRSDARVTLSAPTSVTIIN